MVWSAVWSAVPLVIAALSEPEECQPKTGLHLHQPQYHIIAPMQPGTDGKTRWPAGASSPTGTGLIDSVVMMYWHVECMCEGGTSELVIPHGRLRHVMPLSLPCAGETGVGSCCVATAPSSTGRHGVHLAG